MAYDGLVYLYPDGSRGGVPYDSWQTYVQNRGLYIKYNKPTPVNYVTVNEPDGSVWEYTFSYADPFTCIEKLERSAAYAGYTATGTAATTPIKQTGTPTVTVPIVVTTPGEPEVPTVTDPTGGGGSEPSITEGGGGGISDLIGLGAMVMAAVGLGSIVKTPVRKRKRK